MIYYVNGSVDKSGTGAQDAPFKTIQEAAAIAVAGDEVLVAPGIYREHVNPQNGGTEDAPIIYRSEQKGAAVITGAEVICGWQRHAGDVYKVCLPNAMFGDYNPYTTVISGDWYYTDEDRHTGEVYLNGQALYETDSIEQVEQPEDVPGAWDKSFTHYRWYTMQEGDQTWIYVNFQGADPNENCVEINVRRNCFYPDATGVNYITVSGFTIRQAATTWAPPTAYQDGMVGPHWSKGWVIEDCEISDSKCCGITLGKYLQPNNENKWSTKRLKQGTQTERDAICQAQLEGWTKELIGHHTVRRCEIHDCGQAGIVGHLGCVFSLIEDNHIYHINTRQELFGAETGGIKLHAAIDTVIRRNHIHHCTRGLWLDWQAQGTRVSQNLFHHNVLPDDAGIYSAICIGQDLFIEVSHGPTLVDNNILLSNPAMNIATQGVALVHNLICGTFTSVGDGTSNGPGSGPRYTPYHIPHRTEIAGFMTILHGDDRFYNNIFVHQDVSPRIMDYIKDIPFTLAEITGTNPFEEFPTAEEYFGQFYIEGDCKGHENRVKYYGRLPIYTGGNVYCNGARPCSKEENYKVIDEPVTVQLEEADGKWILKTNLYELLPEMQIDLVTTDTLGEAFEPEQRFENADGSPLTLDTDYSGMRRDEALLSGPFSSKQTTYTVG